MDDTITCRHCGESGGVFHDPSKLYEHEAHCNDVRSPKVGQVEAVANLIFEKIKHGDKAHEDWLRAKSFEISSEIVESSGIGHIGGLVRAIKKLLRDTRGQHNAPTNAPIKREYYVSVLKKLPPEVRGK